MVDKTFQVSAAFQPGNHAGLSSAGSATDQNQLRACNTVRQLVQQVAAHGLVATQYQGVVDTLIPQPLPDSAGAQTAAKAIQVALGVTASKRLPPSQALSFDITGYKLMTQLYSGILPPLFVANSHLRPFIISHQWQAVGRGESAVTEFRRGAHIHHRRIAEKKLPVILCIGARSHGCAIRPHHRTV